ncbi:hydroxyacid dehydrogenase [Halapricum sp. CBA1109]|uniref:NAD(P)-dependent oxidoreductase n=1 Tax=Halapricum sp. CBA1109 TaxID=2668068 RepID=UPI0012F7B440|nr:NAD(P)-dependent oxidoreductase [Halapricum sp. CBA1109]MUV90758.1 hydroxyacid dehydrogenase [Halapricum sp. CBA1109]
MKALVTANFAAGGIERLEALGFDVEFDPIAQRESRLPVETLKERLEGVSVFVSGFEGVPAEVMDAAEQLQLIVCPRGGPEASVDIEAATERDIPVLFAPGRNAETVADHTMGLLLAATRNIALADRRLRDGEYTGDPVADAAAGGEREDVTWDIGADSPYTTLRGPTLGGRTIGIVGFSRIGRRVAKRAGAGFGMDVVAYDPFVDQVEMEPFDVQKVGDLRDLCRRSDVVSLHAAVSPSSRGMIGPEEFAAMPDHAYLINTARAALIEEGALLGALRDDEIAAAGLDVYHEEPLADDDPLLERDDVVLTPHIASASQSVVERHTEMAVSGVEAVVEGDRPMHVANPETLAAFTFDADNDKRRIRQ